MLSPGLQSSICLQRKLNSQLSPCAPFQSTLSTKVLNYWAASIRSLLPFCLLIKLGKWRDPHRELHSPPVFILQEGVRTSWLLWEKDGPLLPSRINKHFQGQGASASITLRMTQQTASLATGLSEPLSCSLQGKMKAYLCCCFSVAKLSPNLRPHGLQHTRLPCPSPSPGVCPSSCP